MTEKNEIRYSIDWLVFWIALIAAPLIVTGATMWITIVSYLALIFGGPVYLAFGTPTLIWYLRRRIPAFWPIIGLALMSLLGMLPIGLLWALITWDLVPLQVMVGMMGYGAIFAPLWAGTFAAIYLRFRRKVL